MSISDQNKLAEIIQKLISNPALANLCTRWICANLSFGKLCLPYKLRCCRTVSDLQCKPFVIIAVV